MADELDNPDYKIYGDFNVYRGGRKDTEKNTPPKPETSLNENPELARAFFHLLKVTLQRLATEISKVEKYEHGPQDSSTGAVFIDKRHTIESPNPWEDFIEESLAINLWIPMQEDINNIYSTINSLGREKTKQTKSNLTKFEDYIYSFEPYDLKNKQQALGVLRNIKTKIEELEASLTGI